MGIQFRLFGTLVLFTELVIATIDANTSGGRRHLLLIQGRISGLLGLIVVLVLLVKDTEILTDLTNEDIRAGVEGFILNWSIGPRLLGFWAIFVGTIRIFAAIRLQPNTANMLLMSTSGVSLVTAGIVLWLAFPRLGQLSGFLLLASGATLIAVAFRARRGNDI